MRDDRHVKGARHGKRGLLPDHRWGVGCDRRGRRPGTIRYWNAGGVAMFGHGAAEAVGQSLDLIVPEAQRARHWDGYRRVMATGTTQYARQFLLVRPASRWTPAVHRVSRELLHSLEAFRTPSLPSSATSPSVAGRPRAPTTPPGLGGRELHRLRQAGAPRRRRDARGSTLLHRHEGRRGALHVEEIDEEAAGRDSDRSMIRYRRCRGIADRERGGGAGCVCAEEGRGEASE